MIDSKRIRRIVGISLFISLQTFAVSNLTLPMQPSRLSVMYGKVEAAVDVRTFGAKGNGVTNDTAAIQAAVNSLGTVGGTVVIPPGTYMVDAVKSINLKNKVNLQMTSTTVLKVIPNNCSDFNSVIRLANIGYANVYGGVLIGDRYKHLGVSGEHGIGVGIFGANNVIVRETVAKDMWGDGFYIGSGANGIARNIQLIDVKADNNRRQGISLISGNNVSIIRPRLTNTNGIAPGYGLDIEPSKSTDTLQNISIVDAYTANNQGAGIGVNLIKIDGSGVPVSVKITNHVDDGSQRGFSSVNGTKITGSVVIDNPIWRNNKLNGLAITNHDYRSYSITVNNPQVINANTKGAMTAPSTGAAFALYSYNSAITIGNVHINNAKITDTRTPAKILSGFYVDNISNKAAVNVSIVKPIINGKVLTMLKAETSTLVKIQ